MQEYRCEIGRCHFVANAEGLVRVSCRYCAKEESERRGYKVVIYHFFDVSKGTLKTLVFRDAKTLIEGR